MPDKKYGMLVTPDIKLHRSWFEEMLKLHGIQVKVKAPREANKHYTLNGELETNYNDWFDTGCIFDEYPNQKTMRKLGWFTEGDEDSSLIHLPYDTPGIQQGMLVSIPSGLDTGKDRLFRVVELSNIMVYPASITCRIIPEWEDTVTMSDLHDFTHSTMNMLKEVTEWKN